MRYQVKKIEADKTTVTIGTFGKLADANRYAFQYEQEYQCKTVVVDTQTGQVINGD